MKKFLRYSLLGVMSLFCGVAFAQTTVTFDATVDKSASADAGAADITKDGVTIAITQGVLGNGKEYRCYKGQTLTITSSAAAIEKVELTCTANGTAKYGPGSFTVADGTYTYDGKIGTWVGNNTSVEFVASVNQGRMTSIVVTLANADPTAPVAPTVDGTTPFEGSTSVTITGEEGTTIYYTIDGTEPTTSTTTNGASPLTFTLDKSATVKAIAVKDGKSSNVAQKEFVAATFVDKTIAQLHELTADLAYVNLTLENAQVVYIDGSTIHVRQGDKAIMFFNTALPLKANAVINGSVKVDYDNYYGIHEVKDNAFTNADNLTITDGTEEAVPTAATIADIVAKKYIADYVIISNVTIVENNKAYYAVDDENNELRLFGNDDLVSQYAGDGKKYSVLGVFNNIYRGAVQIEPTSVVATSGIDNIEAADNAPVEYYNLQGIKMASDNLPAGLYITKQGNKVAKVIVK